MIVRKASSTERSRSWTETRHQGVPTGGGVRDRDKDAQHRLFKASRQRRPENTGDKAQGVEPLTGYSTRTTRRNRLENSQEGLQQLLEGLVDGTRHGNPLQGASLNSSNHRPTMFRAIRPINRIPSRGTSSPKPRLINSRRTGFRVLNGLSCFGIDVRNARTKRLTVVEPDRGGKGNHHQEACNQVVLEILLEAIAQRLLRSGAGLHH